MPGTILGMGMECEKRMTRSLHSRREHSFSERRGDVFYFVLLCCVVGWGQGGAVDNRAGREDSTCKPKAGYNMELGAGTFLELSKRQRGYGPMTERTDPDCGPCRHVRHTHLSPKSKGKPF